MRFPNSEHTPTPQVRHVPTDHSDHSALHITLPATQDMGQQHNTTTAHTGDFPSTRNHPPFILPIPENLLEQYKLGTPGLQEAITKTQA
jgi:hypothetical protein